MFSLFEKYKQSLVFVTLVLILIVYFIFGWYNITKVGITVDEPAHLGASQAYSQQQGTNLEHPVLTKSLTGLVQSVVFPEYKTNIGGPYERGKDFLINSTYEYESVLQTSRLVTLSFNSLILFFLIIYTFWIKFLPAKFSIILAILYTFSPSFFGHNYLVTFDVAGAMTALMAILALAHFYSISTKTSFYHFLGYCTLLSFWFGLAFNTKFTNAILLAPLALTLVIIAIKSIKEKNHKIWLRLISFAFIFLIFNFTLLWVLYNYSFGNIKFSGDYRNLIDIYGFLTPLGWYYEGAKLSLGRSNEIILGFVDDDFAVQTFRRFSFRLFWFKENIGLFVLGGISIFFLFINWIYTVLKQKGSKIKYCKKLLITNFKNITFAIIGLTYPVVYFILSWNSHLTIGYRHFYPILIFVYLIIASLACISKVKNIVLSIVLIIYIAFGITGLPQNIAYANQLWTKEKWRLATDSSLNWGQELPDAYKFLAKQNLITPENKRLIINATWNACLITPEDLVERFSDFKRADNADFYNYYFDLTQKDVKTSGAKYVVVDTFVWQHMSHWSKTNPIAKSNMDYLSSLKPIYNANDVIFIYKLN